MNENKHSLLVCEPKYFDVLYEINPWMHLNIRPHHDLALEEWGKYVEALKLSGADLQLVPQDKSCPDMVFTANAGLVYENKVVLARMRNTERQAEEQHYRNWFESQGYEIFQPQHFFEGEGDCFIIDDKLFAGYGFRSERKAIEEVKDFLGLSAIVYCRLRSPFYYHFDTCFAPLYDGRVLVHRAAFSEAAIKELEACFEIIFVTEEEARNFACNLVVLGKNIVMPANCPKLEKQLTSFGYNVHSVTLDQFLKAGGAAKCLCLRLGNVNTIDNC